MKLASYLVNERESFGVVRDDGIIDLGSRLDGIKDLKSLLDAGLENMPVFQHDFKSDFRCDSVRFLPVIPNPGAILCVGLNTRSHYKEVETIMGLSGRMPDFPWLFVRTARAQVGHLEALEKPNGSPLFDFEGEIAIIIGKRGRFVSEEDALKYVAGYSCFNDGSLRDYQMHSPLFTSGKNFPRSGAFGPWMVTPDEAPSPENLRLRTRVNGQVVQNMSYDDLIFRFPQLISYISHCTELQPGDVIVTGSAAGVGIFRDPPLMLQDGDVCEIEIDGVGILKNPVASATGNNCAPVTRSDVAKAIRETGERMSKAPSAQ